MTNKEASLLSKTLLAKKGDPDSKIPLVILHDLTQEEVQSIQQMSYMTRLSVFQDLSQIHALNNPATGYHVIEIIVNCVRRLTNKSTILEALQLPPQKQFLNGKPDLPRYPEIALLKKVCKAVMNTVLPMNDLGPLYSKSNKVKSRNKLVPFRSFYNRGFLLYRRFVYYYACVANVSYSTAISHCAMLGRSPVAFRKDLMSDIINYWETSQPEDEYDIIVSQMDNFESWWETQTQTVSCKDTFDRETSMTGQEIFSLFKTFAKKDNSRSRKRKPQRIRVARKKSAKKKAKQAPKDNADISGATSATEDSPESAPGDTACEASEANTKRVPETVLFDSEASVDPGAEWLCLEVPYFPCLHNGNKEPELVPGLTFVPKGSEDLQVVLFIKVMPTFVYTFERADIVYHGQVTGEEKDRIEERCRQQNIPYCPIFPKDRLFSMDWVKIADSTSDIYQKAFSGLLLDPVRIHKYLKENVKGVDEDRGVMDKTLGHSTRNYEHHAKTTEEMDRHFLDAPSWVGTDEDFELLSPAICHVVDCIQKFVDLVYPKNNKQLPSEVRFELFAKLLNERLGCVLNRFETITVAIAYLCPRTKVLLRHLDLFNDRRNRYAVTAIWSTVFQDLSLSGELATIRLSIISCTRVQCGNYFERTCSYVTAFQRRREVLMQCPFYCDVNSYEDLDVCKLVRGERVEDIAVFKNGNITIPAIIVPMYFDPTIYLSSFAWCITRLQDHWKLVRRDVVELVYLCSVQSSALPMVWITNELVTEDPEPFQEHLKTITISRLLHREMCKRSQRNSPIGGTHPRHQVSLGHWPGQENVEDISFSKEGDHRESMNDLDNTITRIGNVKDQMKGEDALKAMRRDCYGIGQLNVMKILPLSALVGLFDIKNCFQDALYGQCSTDEPHGKDLIRLGCDTVPLEQTYLKSVNEYLGAPRDHFFLGIMCFA